MIKMIGRVIEFICVRIILVFRYFNKPTLTEDPNLLSSTRNEDEISKFGDFCEDWWDKDGKWKLLHQLNAIRVPFIQESLKRRGVLNPNFINSSTPLKDINILDVGCGGGILCEQLCQLGANVTGIDASEDLIEIARQHAVENNSKINYINDLLENIVARNTIEFDAVVNSECIEHVNAQELLLKSCVDVLKPGGSLIITTFNRSILSWLIGILFYENLPGMIPKGTHDWNKFISPEKVTEILERNNCQTRTVRGFIYNFIFCKWSWIPNNSICYALHAVKNYK